jgi:hypothetical protein
MIEADRKIAEDLMGGVLIGSQITDVEIPVAGTWDFRFEGVHLNIGVPWRILDAEGILLGSCDHEHKFGLPEPVNAVALVMKLLGSKKVTSVSLGLKTADLEVAFEGNMFLSIFNHSSGWEGWNMAGDGRAQIIALGGGDIAIFA